MFPSDHTYKYHYLQPSESWEITSVLCYKSYGKCFSVHHGDISRVGVNMTVNLGFKSFRSVMGKWSACLSGQQLLHLSWVMQVKPLPSHIWKQTQTHIRRRNNCLPQQVCAKSVQQLKCWAWLTSNLLSAACFSLGRGNSHIPPQCF